MEKIWLHGHNCDCPQCRDHSAKVKHMMHDIGGEDLRSIEFPTEIGDRRMLMDQHGNVFDLKYTGWMRPTD